MRQKWTAVVLTVVSLMSFSGCRMSAKEGEPVVTSMEYSSFSRQDLLDQLLYEGFTQEQAEYGVQSAGY